MRGSGDACEMFEVLNKKKAIELKRHVEEAVQNDLLGASSGNGAPVRLSTLTKPQNLKHRENNC